MKAASPTQSLTRPLNSVVPRLVGPVGGAAQRDSRKPGYPGIAGGEVTPARGLRPHDQFEGVAATVAKARHRPCLAAHQRVRICGCRRDAIGREHRDGAIEHRLRAHLEADGLLRGIANLIDQCMVAKIGAKRGLLVRLFDQLQSEDTLCEIDRDWQVARAQADVTQLVDLDHGQVRAALSHLRHCTARRKGVNGESRC